MLGPAPSCRPREQTVAQSRTDNRILPFQTSGEAAAALSASGMVSCVVVGCHNKTQSSKKKKECKVADARFFKIPKVRTRECDTTRTLSARRQREWLKRINRKDLDADLDKYKVCSRHFVSGECRHSLFFSDINFLELFESLCMSPISTCGHRLLFRTRSIGGSANGSAPHILTFSS
ncbi:uncharacterized protein ISCGN_026079 [Ixodes scapularis]